MSSAPEDEQVKQDEQREETQTTQEVKEETNEVTNKSEDNVVPGKASVKDETTKIEDRNARNGNTNKRDRPEQGKALYMYPSSEKNKSDASALPPSEDALEILQQVEFYFSDSNLPQDKFLWTTAQKDNGWVPLDVICKFKRMARFPADKVAEALRESTLLEVDSAGKKIKRKLPLEYKSAFDRTLHISNLPDETKTMQFDLEKYFKVFGAVSVRMRREDDGSFKGDLYVEFSSEKQIEDFRQTDREFEGKKLDIETKKEFIDKKKLENANQIGSKDLRQKFNGFKYDKRPQRDGKKGRFENNRGRNQYRGRGRGRGERRERNDESTRQPGEGDRIVNINNPQ